MVRRKTLRLPFTLMFSFSMVMGGLPSLPFAAAEDIVPPSLETVVSPDVWVDVDTPAEPLPADPVVVDGDVGGVLPPAEVGTEVPVVEEPVLEAPAPEVPAPAAPAPEAPVSAVPSLMAAPAGAAAVIDPLAGTGPVDGAIDVTKTVLDSAGNPVDMDTLPDDYEFVVNIDGPGHDFDVVAHLNAGNDWTERFDPMHHGDYKVTENYPDYDLYGVLIDGEPDYSAPFAFELEESGHYTLPDGRPLGKVEIINKHVPDGELEISKEFHSFAGVPIEPMEGAEVTFNVTGPDGYDETFVLSDLNGWSKLLEGLVTGDYVISEESIEGFTACYMLDDVMLDLPATVHVDDGGSAAITICNMADPDGRLDITKTFETFTGISIDPPEGFEIVLNVTGPEGFDETFTLSEAMGWSKSFDGLIPGEYVITEEAVDGFTASYWLDDEMLDLPATVMVEDRADTSVTVLNTADADGRLDIDKIFETFTGISIDPPEGFEIVLNVTGPEEFDETFTLSEAMGWSKSFDGLLPGDYVISEEAVDGFTASYWLGDEALDLPATVTVEDRETTSVTVLNTADADGRLDIMKEFETFAGVPIDPLEDAEIVINVTGPEGFDETFTLSDDLGWSKSFDGLLPGEYLITEEGIDGFTASYWLDDVMLDLPAMVDVEDRATTSVTILNTADPDGRIDISKEFETFTGVSIDPPEDLEITINVTGPEGYDETFILSEAEGWSKTLMGLLPGEYVISEESVDGFTASFWFDGEMLDLPATVMVEDRVTSDVIVLNTADADGRLDIDKIFETFTGISIDPPEGFEIVLNVTGPEEFDETFTLSEAMGWSKSFDGLLPGDYVISEEAVDGFTASYWLGDEALDLPATVTVEDRETTSVTVLNTADADGGLEIMKEFETFTGIAIDPPEGFEIVLNVTGPEEFDETFTLSEAMGWSKSFDGLIPGEYVITEEAVDGFTASYWLGEEALDLPATVMVEDREATLVTVLNTADADGRLDIEKIFETFAGVPIEVAPEGAEITINVTGPDDYDETFVLNDDLGWSKSLTGLVPGEYIISEEGIEGFTASFWLGDEMLELPATVMVEDRATTEVTILNTADADGSLQVTKEYRTAAGQPATGAAVSVQVTGPEEFDETFTLNAANEWMMVFEGLLPGDYTIHELTTGDFKTTYEFDGLALETPVVEVMDREMTEVVVVNTLPAPAPPVEQYTVDKVASVTTAKIGDTITYTVTVKNTGEIAIANKPISDTLVPSLPVTGTPTIEAGASWSFSYTYKVPATFTGTNLVNVVKVGDITDTVTVPITKPAPVPLKTGDDLRMAYTYGVIALLAGATALTARRRRGVVRTK